jgi:hypothetical protein
MSKFSKVLKVFKKAISPLSDILGPAGGILNAISGAQGLFSKEESQKPPRAAQAKPFSANRPTELGLPGSLNELSAFSPEQQRSALATRGVNQGLGSDEDSYYKNLIQRSLIGDGNKVDKSNPNFLMPIESQYFSQKGLNTSDIMKFLQGLSG